MTDLYRRTLDRLADGVQIIGHDWTYLYVNAAAARRAGSTPERLEGRSVREASPGLEQTPLFRILEQSMASRQAATVESPIQLDDGSEHWLHWQIEPVQEGLFVHSIDLGRRQEADAASGQRIAALEQALAKRTEELEALTEEFQAFSHAISHDLRAPLRHIVGFAALLNEQSAALDDEGRDDLARITRASVRMGRLMEDLLAFARAGRGPLVKEPIDLATLIDELRQEVASDAEGRAIEWAIGPLPQIEADRALLRLALGNLLANAVKFTRHRSPSRIAVDATVEVGANEVHVSVSDNGVGFDMAYASRLFGVFQRLHSESEFEGTGVGLAVVRRIIRRHGGRTWAKGEVGTGATFAFSLPR